MAKTKTKKPRKPVEASVSVRDVSTLFLLVEPAAHALEGIKGIDWNEPSYEAARNFLDKAICVLQELTGTDYEFVEVDDDVNDRLDAFLGRVT